MKFYSPAAKNFYITPTKKAALERPGRPISREKAGDF